MTFGFTAVITFHSLLVCSLFLNSLKAQSNSSEKRVFDRESFTSELSQNGYIRGAEIQAHWLFDVKTESLQVQPRDPVFPELSKEPSYFVHFVDCTFVGSAMTPIGHGLTICFEKCTFTGSLSVANTDQVDANECLIEGSLIVDSTTAFAARGCRVVKSTSFAGHLVEDRDLCIGDCEFEGEVRFTALDGIVRAEACRFRKRVTVDSCSLEELALRRVPDLPKESSFDGGLRVFHSWISMLDVFGSEFSGVFEVASSRVDLAFVQECRFSQILVVSDSLVDTVRFWRPRFLEGLFLDNYQTVTDDDDDDNVDGEPDWHGTVVLVDDVRIGGPYYQFQPAGRLGFGDGARTITSGEAQTWRELERAWRKAGNERAANTAAYEAERVSGSGVWRLVSDVVWGFGYRPWRIVAWLLAVVVFFAVMFATQARSVAGIARRAFRSVEFSIRSAWKWKWGWEHTRTPFWRAIVMSEQVVFKALLLLLLHSLTKTSPLLRDLFQGLLP